MHKSSPTHLFLDEQEAQIWSVGLVQRGVRELFQGEEESECRHCLATAGIVCAALLQIARGSYTESAVAVLLSSKKLSNSSVNQSNGPFVRLTCPRRHRKGVTCGNSVRTNTPPNNDSLQLCEIRLTTLFTIASKFALSEVARSTVFRRIVLLFASGVAALT